MFYFRVGKMELHNSWRPWIKALSHSLEKSAVDPPGKNPSDAHEYE